MRQLLLLIGTVLLLAGCANQQVIVDDFPRPEPIPAGSSVDCTKLERDTDLHGCDLSGKDLAEKNLFNANLAGANLTGAKLKNADLRFASGHDTGAVRTDKARL